MKLNPRSTLWIGLLITRTLAAADWPTYGHDPARTNWAAEEVILNPGNAADLHLEWKAKLDNQPLKLAALTSPIVVARKDASGNVRNIVYVAGAGGTVFALDGQTGSTVWKRPLHTMALPGNGGFQGTFLCPNGITATPVASREDGNLYVIASDGALYGLDLDTGKVNFGPASFVAPFSKTWSLNLVDGTIYTSVSLGCGNGRAGIYAADIRHPQQPAFHQLFLSKAYTAGIWGRGGVVIGGNGIAYGGTADGDTDPKSGDYSNAVVAARLSEPAVSDYFLPTNYQALKKADMDVGSASPVWFKWNGRNILAHGFKEGVVYLLDADHLGSADHQTPLFASPRLGNDRAECCASSGIWGSLSAARDKQGVTWLYIPMGGPPAIAGAKFPLTNGDNPHGSIMAFRVLAGKDANPVLAPAWISGDFHYPDPPVIANGLVFGLSNGENPDQRGDESRRALNTHRAVLKVLDAATGKELFNSGASIETWVHFSALALANGQVFAVDHSSNVYCFGVSGKRMITSAQNVKQAENDELSTSWVGRAERSGDIMRGWIKRVVVATVLVVLAAFAGIVLAYRQPRPS